MDDLGFGLWMTLFGMGTVFLLLFLLMGILWLIGWKPQGKAKADESGKLTQVASSVDSAIDRERAAAIMVAIAAHRNGEQTPGRIRILTRLPEQSRWSAITQGMQLQHLPVHGRD